MVCLCSRRGHTKARPATGHSDVGQRDHDEGAALRPLPTDSLRQKVRTSTALQCNAGMYFFDQALGTDPLLTENQNKDRLLLAQFFS